MKTKTKPEMYIKTIMTKFVESLECQDDLTCEMSAGMLMLAVGRRPQLSEGLTECPQSMAANLTPTRDLREPGTSRSVFHDLTMEVTLPLPPCPCD